MGTVVRRLFSKQSDGGRASADTDENGGKYPISSIQYPVFSRTQSTLDFGPWTLDIF